MTDEERIQVIESVFQALWDNHHEGGTFGRLIERLGLRGVPGAWERVQTSGGLWVHNELVRDED